MTDIVLVLTTVSAGDRGDTIARTLIEERLAACVNVHGAMWSTYRWKGQIERDAEQQVVIKTTRDRLPDLEKRLQALHTYEVPEFLVVAIESGSAAYLDWVASEVGRQK